MEWTPTQTHTHTDTHARTHARTCTHTAAVVREIAIMRRLAGHPSALQLIEAAESASNYYIAMELCSGGELFDQIIGR